MLAIVVKKRGFTLVELLLVIIIVGALAGMMMISAGSATDKTNVTRCLADRRTIKSAIDLYRAEHGSYVGVKDALKEKFDKSLNDPTGSDTNFVYAKSFPSGGDYIISMDTNSNCTVTCNIVGHGDMIAHASFGDKILMDKIVGIFKDENIPINGSRDSTASFDGARTTAVIAALKELGIDLQAMGATTWRCEKNDNGKSFLYWSTQDINTLAVGATLPVIRYNFTTGTYTVWQATVASNTHEGSGSVYNVLCGVKALEQYKPSTKDDKVQSYETALKNYLEFDPSKI